MSDRQVIVPEEIQEYYDAHNLKIVVLDNHEFYCEVTVFNVYNNHRKDIWHWSKWARCFMIHRLGDWER